MSDISAKHPGAGDHSPGPGGGWLDHGASGDPTGPSGVPLTPARRALLIIVLVVASIDSVNILSALHDAARNGGALPAWKPIAAEYTSGFATLCFSGLIYLATRAAPPSRVPWWRFAVVHLGASLAFSGLHVVGMVLLRKIIFAVMGLSYGLPLSDFPYEYRKDLLAYVILGGIFWTAERLSPSRSPRAAPPALTTFDIVESARISRVRVQEILSVQSAGNYVEFRLADGRRRLMRTTLASVETKLTQHGFLRTHRSWLVNAEGLRTLHPTGSGDFRIGLVDGTEAPLSRRYPDAAHLLKKGRGG